MFDVHDDPVDSRRNVINKHLLISVFWTGLNLNKCHTELQGTFIYITELYSDPNLIYLMYLLPLIKNYNHTADRNLGRRPRQIYWCCSRSPGMEQEQVHGPEMLQETQYPEKCQWFPNVEIAEHILRLLCSMRLSVFASSSSASFLSKVNPETSGGTKFMFLTIQRAQTNLSSSFLSS